MTPTIPYLVIPGTHAWKPKELKGQWHHARPHAQDDSAFTLMMRREGFERIDADDPYVWSTLVDGLFYRKLSVWHSSALNFKAHVTRILRLPPLERVVLVHSHGLQVAYIAAALGCYIHTLIDICGPVRHDVIQEYGEAARKNIGYHVHVHSDRSDRMQIWGGLLDGVFKIVRPHPDCVGDHGLNHEVPKAEHSLLLHNPDEWYAGAWQTWLDIARTRHGRADT
jgi:hypothetical protein